MKALDALVYLAAAVAIIALPVSLVNWFRYMQRRKANKFDTSVFASGFPVKSVMFFAVPLLIAMAIAQGMATSSREEALAFIRGLSGNYSVYVNHERVPDGDKIISALKQISSGFGHHSHPTTRIHVEIHSEKGNMTFELGRDSALPQEYWVFYPKYRLTSNYDIGTVTTPAFDQY